MLYETYKFIQANLVVDSKTEYKVNFFEYFRNNLNECLLNIDAFVSKVFNKGFFDDRKRDKLYDLISYIRIKCGDDDLENIEMCNLIIEKLNTVNTGLFPKFIINETFKRNLSNSRKIQFNEIEIVYDYIYLMAIFSNKFNSSDYIMKLNFLRCVRALVLENPDLIYSDIFINNVLEVINSNIKYYKNKKTKDNKEVFKQSKKLCLDLNELSLNLQKVNSDMKRIVNK